MTNATEHDADVIEAEFVEDTTTSEALATTTTTSMVTPARIIGGIPYFDEYMQLASAISRTAMVPSALRNKPDEVLAVVMYGAELGIGPMQALQQINFIEGKPSMAPELMRALIRQAGHKLSIKQSKTVCVIVGERGDTGEIGETEFTLEDAVDAGLCSVDGAGKVRARSAQGKILPWEKYTRDMLLARATSRIARMMFSDVIAGMSYTPEEIESFTTSDEPSERRGSSSRSSSRASSESRSRRAAPAASNEPSASEEKIALIRDGIGALSDEQKARVSQTWQAEQLPPLARGLSESQAQRAWAIVSEILDETPAQASPSAETRESASDAPQSDLDASQSDLAGSDGAVKRGADAVSTPKLSRNMYGKIRGLCRELYGYEEAEDCELKCSSILGHGVTLASMTRTEGHKCIDWMEQDKANRAASTPTSSAADDEEPF